MSSISVDSFLAQRDDLQIEISKRKIFSSFDQSKIQSFETQSFVNAHAFSLSLFRSFVPIEVSVPSWQCEFKWPVTSVVFTFITLRRDEAANIRPIDRSSTWMNEWMNDWTSSSSSVVVHFQYYCTVIKSQIFRFSFFFSLIVSQSIQVVDN